VVDIYICMYIVYLTVFITAFACQVSTMRNVLVRVRNNFSESRPGRTCIKSLSTGISHGCLRTHFAHVDVKRSAQRKAAGVRSAFRHVCKHCSVEGTQHSQQHRLQRPGRDIVVYWYSFSNPRTVCIHYGSTLHKIWVRIS